MRGDSQDLSMSLAQLCINSMELRGQPGSANTATFLEYFKYPQFSCFLSSTTTFDDDILN